MSTPEQSHHSVFERIKRVNQSGNEFWSSRELARILEYADYRNIEQVIARAKHSCFNSGQRIEDHFVDITEMVDIGSGAQRAIQTVYLSRYACYLIIQNADPTKEVVALGQSYFAVQTRGQELESVVRNSRITAADGNNYETKHYVLDATIGVDSTQVQVASPNPAGAVRLVQHMRARFSDCRRRDVGP